MEACKKSLKISGKDISEYVITYNKAASTPSTAHAAEELQSFIFKTTGITPAIETGSVFGGKPAVRLVYREDMGDNYSLKTDECGLIISGGKRGILYGVYNFLEDHIGWAFLPYGTDVLMSDEESIEIDNLDYEYKQYFEYRAPFWHASYDNDFAVKNMINYNMNRTGDTSIYGDFFGFVGGYAHTFAALIGDSSYKGSIGENPCMYDERLYETMLSNVRKLLATKPDAELLSVTANDSGDFCSCDKCTGKSVGGNRTDGLLGLVNRIAEAIEPEYPNVKIQTFAYGPTHLPPVKNMPRKNVVVQLCSHACCYRHAHDDEKCVINHTFMNDIREWSKLTDNLYIWDYVTNFRYYLVPFPNFKNMASNIRNFYKYNVKGIFEQGNEHNNTGEFGEMKAYLEAKLMKNPLMTDEEYDALIDKFMRGYYGAGWQNIKKYLDFLNEASEKMEHFGIYAIPENMFCAQDFADRKDEIDALFDAAEAAAEDENTLKHIKGLRLSYTYLKLFFTFDKVMENGTDEEKAQIRAQSAAAFDAIASEDIRLLDVHPPLAEIERDYNVDKSDHPRRWTPSQHLVPGLADHGLPGRGGLGDAVYGNSNL